ncbi:MAG TPA: glycohydrolase toxin TNT-related protein [Gammaproteobacteria bacterium]|nr:glycohydrolase toxin TNT-related protein [Gammaproteobacteria bacterium]
MYPAVYFGLYTFFVDPYDNYCPNNNWPNHGDFATIQAAQQCADQAVQEYATVNNTGCPYLPLTPQGWVGGRYTIAPWAAIGQLYTCTPPFAGNATATALADCPQQPANVYADYPGKCVVQLPINYDKNAGPTCPKCQGTSDPINTGTGNQYQAVTDYKGGGVFPLTLIRSYNNLTTTGGGWSFNVLSNGLSINMSYAAIYYTAYITVYEDSGRAYLFWSPTSGNVLPNPQTLWSHDSDVAGQLLSLNSGFQYTAEDGTIEIYDADGRLVSVTNHTGLTQTYQYDNGGSLESVTDPFGRQMVFAYDVAGHVETMTNPAGGTYTYKYDSLGNLIRATYPDGTKVKYQYTDTNNPSALTGIIDEDGNQYASWTYDAYGRTISFENAGGANQASVVYNDDGSTDVTEPTGLARHLIFENISGSVRFIQASAPCTECGDLTQSITYDIAGFPSVVTDFNGNNTGYVYDDATGLVTSRTDAVLNTTTTQWNVTLREPTLITEPGRIRAYSYDAAGRVLSKTVTDTTSNVSRTTSYQYNNQGLLASVTDPRGNATSYSYDGQGNIVSITNALGQVTQITQYDANGNPLTIIDPNGVETDLSYDERQRPISRTVAGATTRFKYDNSGNLIKVRLPTGAYQSYSYDAAHRLVEIEDNLGDAINYTLDNVGNRISEHEQGSGGNVTRTAQRVYDNLEHLVKTISGTNQVTSYGDDGLGNPLTVTDPLDNTIHQIFDALNRLKSAVDPLNGNTTYNYNALDYMTNITDPKGLNTNYSYDAFGDVLETDSSDTRKSTFTYDLNGNRTSQTDARGITTSYTYDVLNRLTSVQYPTAAEDITYCYDQGTYGIGHLTTMQDSSGTTTYAYDARGNVIEKTVVMQNLSFTVSYGYNRADELKKITYPDGMRVKYARDAADRIDSITESNHGVHNTVVSGITYEPFGPVLGMTYGNGLVETRTYDLDYKPMSISISGVASWAYAEDANGNVASIQDTLNSASNQVFAYDALERLISAQGAYGNLGYSYDADGNRIQTTSGGTTVNLSYDSASNRLLSESDSPFPYQYDQNGNTTFDGNHSYYYDDTNRFVGFDGSATAYIYNALGQRVAKPDTLVPGDANGDGIINQEDLTLLLEALGGQIAFTPGMDCDQNGKVNNADVQCLQNLLNQSMPSMAQSSIKPSIICIGSCGGGDGGTLVANDGSVTTFENTSINGTLSGSDSDGDPITFAIDGQPIAGTVTITDPSTGAFTYTPNNGFTGTDNFTFSVSDGNSSSAATETITVLTPNQVPVANNGYVLTQQNQSVAGTLSAADDDGDALTFQVITQPQHGSVTINNAATGAFTYTPTSGFNGKDSFTFDASDGQSISNIATESTVTFAALHANGNLYFIYDEQGHLLGEYDKNGNLRREHIWLGNTPVGVVTIRGLDYVHADQLDTPRVITDVNGKPVWQWASDPFGNGAANEDPGSSGINYTYNLRLPGQYYDTETGLSYNMNRYINSAIGRYTGSDTIGLDGGINTYGYVGNNPMNIVDRFGLAGGEEDEDEVEEEPLSQMLSTADAVNLINQIHDIDPEFSIARDASSKGYTENDVQFLKDYLKALQEQRLCSSSNASPPTWPPNNGFLLYPIPETLQPGDVISRYGTEGGMYASSADTPFPARSLPDQSLLANYTEYTVLKPFAVQSGLSAPWFGQPGMGTQYLLPTSIGTLVEQGYLQRVGP